MPPQLGFYHLTRTAPDAALPELLGKTLGAGQRAVVRCASPARVAQLDKALWQPKRPDWLPHGHAGTGHAEWQPIWLTAGDDSPNGARYLFLLDGTEAGPADWARIFDLFDGTDADAIAAARLRWAAARAAGSTPEYWQQTESGWAKK